MKTRLGDPLAATLQEKVKSNLATAEFDWLMVALQENVAYVTGYRSVPASMQRRPMAVVALGPDSVMIMAGGASDSASVIEDGIIDADSFVPYGRFFYEEQNGSPASGTADVHPDLSTAAAAVLERVPDSATVGMDASAQAVVSTTNGRPMVDATDWMLAVRSQKEAGEVERLKTVARLTEDAIDASLSMIRPGVTEFDVARQVAGHMAEGGAFPKFIVVTSGERSALGDAAPTTRKIESGDLVRFDVGGVLDGYWSDIGRTVVVGQPNALQEERYEAILAGEDVQLEEARPGVSARHLFEVAIETVEAKGIRPYRRHHCGHGIGSEVYEPPIIAPEWDRQLEAGMTFCFETPFYELGWGGMMVEDTLVITDDGCELLNRSDRNLRIV